MDVERYIEESNAIEGVFNDAAVQQSLEAWRFLEDQDELSHEVVKETHRLILKNRQPEVAGKYRDVQVVVGNDRPPAPGRVPGLMSDLLERKPSSGEEAVRWHVEFEKIHPFRDGNGRVGRMMYWWHCRNLETEPVLWKASEREDYYDLFSEEAVNRDLYQTVDPGILENWEEDTVERFYVGKRVLNKDSSEEVEITVKGEDIFIQKEIMKKIEEALNK